MWGFTFITLSSHLVYGRLYTVHRFEKSSNLYDAAIQIFLRLPMSHSLSNIFTVMRWSYLSLTRDNKLPSVFCLGTMYLRNLFFLCEHKSFWLIRGSEFNEFSFISEKPRIIFERKSFIDGSSRQCSHKILELNQSAKNFNCSHISRFTSGRK